jgi:hypothetical protein
MQGVQSLLPQRPVAAKPLIYFCERCGAKTVDPPLRLLAGLDQPRCDIKEVAQDSGTPVEWIDKDGKRSNVSGRKRETYVGVEIIDAICALARQRERT